VFAGSAQASVIDHEMNNVWAIGHSNSPAPRTFASHGGRTERLVHAAARADQRAWDELVKEFSPVLRRVIGAFRLGEHQVDDAIQATWLRLVLSIHTIEDPAAVPGWLVTTARREAIRSRHAASRDLVVEEVHVAEPAATASTEDHAVLRERRTALRAAVSRLPARQHALAASLLTERTYSELAQELRMPIGSIGPIRARLMARLRRDPVLVRAVA
jgi:RNA polymerase sigma factor (sigma-70 family)